MSEQLTKRFDEVWSRLEDNAVVDRIYAGHYTRIRSHWFASACPANIEEFIYQHLKPTVDVRVDAKSKTPFLDTMEQLNTLREKTEARKAERARVMMISSFISMALVFTYYSALLLIIAKVLHHAWRLLLTGAL